MFMQFMECHVIPGRCIFIQNAHRLTSKMNAGPFRSLWQSVNFW